MIGDHRLVCCLPSTAPARRPRDWGILSIGLRGLVCGLSTVAAFTVVAEGIEGLGGLGPAPIGLASNAFLGFDPAQMPAARDAAPVSARPAFGGPPAAWRPLSPAERARLSPVDADLFPHTRRAVPLLVPAAADVTSQPPAPPRAMNGPSVGVRWRVPGYAP